jgi:hypothetical protein
MNFIKAFNSPFKRPKLEWYFGNIALGTPYFFPRRWIKDSEKSGYLKAVPKRVGFDFVDLGWKTKWTATDYRFEWSPRISFVFFGLQIAVTFIVPETPHYWEAWLYYERNTDKTLSTEERLKQCIKGFPLNYTRYQNGHKDVINYYNMILKSKYLNAIK